MTRRWFRGAILCLSLYWLALCILTHVPARDLPHVEVSDKLEHFAAFTLLGFLLNAVLHQLTRRHADWLTLAIVLVYGALDEWLQPLTGRSGEFSDWLADGAGAAAAVVLCNLARGAWALWLSAYPATSAQAARLSEDLATTRHANKKAGARAEHRPV